MLGRRNKVIEPNMYGAVRLFAQTCAQHEGRTDWLHTQLYAELGWFLWLNHYYYTGRKIKKQSLPQYILCLSALSIAKLEMVEQHIDSDEELPDAPLFYSPLCNVSSEQYHALTTALQTQIKLKEMKLLNSARTSLIPLMKHIHYHALNIPLNQELAHIRSLRITLLYRLLMLIDCKRDFPQDIHLLCAKGYGMPPQSDATFTHILEEKLFFEAADDMLPIKHLCGLFANHEGEATTHFIHLLWHTEKAIVKAKRARLQLAVELEKAA